MRIRGKAPVKAPLLLWDLHSSSRDEWELDWRKRDGRAFLAMRLSWTKAQSHSRVSWLCSGTRSRSIFLGQECWGAWGSLLEKVDRDKMLEGPWPKQRHLCLSWNVTGNYRWVLRLPHNLISTQKNDGLDTYPWFTEKILLLSLSTKMSVFWKPIFFLPK